RVPPRGRNPPRRGLDPGRRRGSGSSVSRPVDIGIASLADVQPVTVDGTRRTHAGRVEQIVSLAVLADELGLDHFGLGEHHNPDFAVSSPAVVVSAIAARTTRL